MERASERRNERELLENKKNFKKTQRREGS